MPMIETRGSEVEVHWPNETPGAAAAAPPPIEAPRVPVRLNALPPAELRVDGEARGNTPFQGTLTEPTLAWDARLPAGPRRGLDGGRGGPQSSAPRRVRAGQRSN